MLTVTSVNDAPVAEGQDVSTDEDNAIQIFLSGSDVDGDELVYEVVSSPLNGVLTGDIPVLTYNPFENYNGADTFIFGVSDGTLSDTALVNIAILSVNDAPVISEAIGTEVIVGSLYSELIYATDVDGGLLTFSSPLLPEWTTFQDIGDNTAIIEGVPQDEDEGVHDVLILVTDGEASDTLSFSITVHPSDYLNAPPVWLSEPITETNEEKIVK